MRSSIAVVAILVSAASASVAHAQGEQPAAGADARDASRSAFRRGVAQYENGNFDAARDSFEEAYKLFPHPSILYNLGLALWKTRAYQRAETLLLKFLEDDGGAPPADVANARSVLAQVRQHLGTFLLRVSPSGARARLDDSEVALIPGKFVEVRTTVGGHALHVEAEGYAPQDRSLDVGSSAPSQVDLSLDRTGEAPSGGGPARGGLDARAIAGWSLAGGAVAAASLSVACALEASSMASDYNTPGSGHFQDASTKSTGITFRTLADVAGGIALVAAGVGVYLLLTPSRAAAPQAGVVLGPMWLGASGRF